MPNNEDSKGTRCIVVSLLKKSKSVAQKIIKIHGGVLRLFGFQLRWDRWEHLVKCEDVPPDTSITNKVGCTLTSTWTHLAFLKQKGRFSTCAVQYCPKTNRPQVYKSIMFFLANMIFWGNWGLSGHNLYRSIVVFRSHLACCAGLFGYFLGWWEDWTNRHGPLRQTGAQDCLGACSRGSDVE